MVRQLEPEDIVQMLEVMADAAPAAVHRLAGELVLRLDIAGDVRDRVAVIAAMLGDDRDRAPRSADPRRRTQAAVLIGAAGRIEDCLHDDNAGPHGDASALSAALCGDGYRVASTELDRAHDIVAAAARATVEAARALPSSYYLGRDLLDLGDAHVRGPGARRDPAAAALARAVELVAAGEPARALPLLERCDPGHPDAAAALAAALLAQDRPAAAIAALDRALAAEPDWPLHHWNLAVALRRLGDHRGCHHALCRFVATSAAPSGLSGDPDQAARLRWAERAIAELERGAWIERGSGSCAT
ncbi:MAG: tetratricopeptide repeat protein [Deltaproteobacteria bacterium]|nr:MAG: tetratricopeptide repeat protein [Deltaproteobacteria bacterium]